jgi:predicted DCC family thiol-disulfide oxidoreductase YuxK
METGVIVTDHPLRLPELAPAPVVPGSGADVAFRSVSALASVSEDVPVDPATAGEASEESEPAAGSDVLFFDGECLFCQARVRWLQRRDRDGYLTFAPLQGAFAARCLAGTGLTEGQDGESGVSTMVLVAGFGRPGAEIFIKARAVAAVAARLPCPWRLGGLLALIPRPLADAGYDWVAQRRHRWARPVACALGPVPGRVDHTV